VRKFLRGNLRTRLTLLYAFLLAAALLLYAGCVSVFFLHNLRNQLDSSLDRDEETVEAVMQKGPDGRLLLESHEGEAEEKDDLDRGYLLEVWSHDGRLLYRTEQLAGQRLGPPWEIDAKGATTPTLAPNSPGSQSRSPGGRGMHPAPPLEGHCPGKAGFWHDTRHRSSFGIFFFVCGGVLLRL
jgi:hypothetical protein